MVRGIGAHRRRYALAIGYRHDLRAFITLGLADLLIAAIDQGKRRVDVALALLNSPCSRSAISTSDRTHAKSDVCTTAESVDELFCGAHTSATACSAARQYSRPRTPPRAPRPSAPVFDRVDRRGCSAGENIPGSVPSACCLVEP